MKSVLACLVLVTLCSCATTLDNQGEKAAIRTVLDDSTAAWNQGDLEAFVEPYAADARFVTQKAVTVGRDFILARYKKKYSNRELMGRLSLKLQHVTLSPGKNPTSATVIARWKIERSSGQVLEGATLIVFHKLGGQWVIVEDHSS